MVLPFIFTQNKMSLTQLLTVGVFSFNSILNIIKVNLICKIELWKDKLS